MAKRDPEKLRRQREEQVKRQLMILGLGAVAALFVILFFVSRGRGTSSVGNGNAAGTAGAAAGADAAATGVADAAAGADAAAVGSADVTGAGAAAGEAADAGAATGDVLAVSAEAGAGAISETEAPAVLVTEGSIDGGVVTFVNDPSYSEKITILGTGDNLIHEALYLDARTEDGYDFTPMYARVKPYIQAADIATVNQESPLATAIAEPSGYPAFNTPTQDGDALIDAGFDIINHANNHVLDMGEEGIEATLDYWDSKGIPYFGVYRDSEDKRNIRVLEKNGIKVAFLGFVNWTNKDPTDETDSQLTWIDDEEAVQSYIERAREEADIVVVYAHWGEENENVITEQMSSMAQNMVDWGADLIFGDHTHLVQKITVLQRESDGALCPVQFCGGNFISGQKERAHLLSVLTTAEFAKNPDTGKVVCTGLSALPLVTHYEGDRTNVSIYPLDDYTEELAESNGVKQFEGETMTLDYLWELINAEIPEQFLAHTAG